MSRAPTLAALRAAAASRTFAPSVTIEDAVRALGFVQADPIRAPSRAQDLILRHRVPGYREGDLEREYPRLGLEEEMVHVHGFLPRAHAALLRPRPLGPHWQGFLDERRALRRDVLRFVAAN